MVMWIDDDELIESITSDDPETVRAAVLYLGETPQSVINFCLRGGVLPGFGQNTLDKLSQSEQGINQAVQGAFLNLVWQADCVEPPLREPEQTRLAAAAVLVRADYRIASEVALKTQIAEIPEQAITLLLHEIGRNPLSTPDALQGAKYLVHCFAGAMPTVRDAARRGLAQWPSDAAHQAVINNVSAEMISEES